jgi:hypothetical protein
LTTARDPSAVSGAGGGDASVDGATCGRSTSEKRSLMVRPRTVTSPQCVLTDGFTLSRSNWEVRLGDTPTRFATSHAEEVRETALRTT